MTETATVPTEVKEASATSLVKDFSANLKAHGVDANGVFEPIERERVRQQIIGLFGTKDAEVLSTVDDRGRKVVVLNIPFASGLSTVILMDEQEVANWATVDWAISENTLSSRPNPLTALDIIYVAQSDHKSFSYKSVLPSSIKIKMDGSRSYASSGFYDVIIPPVGPFKPPKNPLERVRWNRYKRIEPIAKLHEAGHSHQQSDMDNWGKLSMAQSERGAWAFALNTYRKIKREGLDLLPDIHSNEQIISRLEYSLLTYSSDPKNYNPTLRFPNNYLSKRKVSHKEPPKGSHFTRRYQRPSPFEAGGCLDNFYRATRALGETVIKDPSIATNAILYKGTPKLTQVSFAALVAA